MKKISPLASRELLEAVTALCVVVPLLIRFVYPEKYHAEFCLTVAFFYLFEAAFVWALRRQDEWSAQKRVSVALILRGVKFIGVLTLMAVYVIAIKRGRNFFLIYTLLYYLLTSALEALATAAHNRNDGSKKDEKVE